MTLQGKGFFIWKIRDCENGDAAAIAEAAHNAGLSHVLLKVANGSLIYNYDPIARRDLVPPVVQALQTRGIAAWGWHYVYGDDPLGEARIAAQRVRELNLAGYVINAEAEYKQTGKREAAKTFMAELRKRLPNTPLALSSYRYPSYHPQLPWREFLERCDINMPQVYWIHASNPAAQLARSVREFQGLTPFRAVIPTGAAFAEHGWTVQPNEVQEFLGAVGSSNLSGANFWSWDYCRNKLPTVWNVIAQTTYDGAAPAIDISEQYMQALNSRNLDRILVLYTDNAVHINATRTVQGKAAIRIWYEALFNQHLPNPVFVLTGYSGSGSSRHVTWNATSNAGYVLNGNDTLGLVDEKISYHFTFFTLA